MNKIQDEILQTIEHLMNRKIEKAGYDKTSSATVLEVLNNNQYVVLMNGRQYTFYCAVNMTFVGGNGVWITIPQNDADRAYISGRKY